MEGGEPAIMGRLLVLLRPHHHHQLLTPRHLNLEPRAECTAMKGPLLHHSRRRAAVLRRGLCTTARHEQIPLAQRVHSCVKVLLARPLLP